MTLTLPTYSIVIPLYNEEACVERSMQEILTALEASFVHRYELILVINGSTDRTGAICEAFAQRYPQVRTLRAVKNLGYGGGILRGLAEARGMVCGFMCGDGQVAPASLIRIMETIGQGDCDLVKARRIHRGDGLARRVQSVVYNWLFGRLFPVRCADINAMPKFMTRAIYERLALESRDWFIDAELMIKASYAGLRVKEVPIEYLPRIGGASVVRLSAVFEFLRNALRIRASKKFDQWKQRSAVRQQPALVAAGSLPLDHEG